MCQIVHARFEDGVFKPDSPPQLPPNTRVLLRVEPVTTPGPEPDDAWTELEELWDEVEIDSGGPPPTRDQLYDRH
jgi:predicted DNA-binding antitoxin AbrB/MazE fold protein